MGWSLGYDKQMNNLIFEKNTPSLNYIVNNWPRTKNILKKYVLSNYKKPNFYRLCKVCLKQLNFHKIKNYEKTLKILSKQCSLNPNYNTYHDQHHFKTVVIISCLLAKLIKLKNKDKILLVIIALTHDMNHQGRRVLKTPYFQEDRSANDLKKVFFKKILNHKEWKRIHKIFQSTYFPVKPEIVIDDLEKIILDADILASLMFGMRTGIKLAKRLKHEIRFEENAEKLFGGFLKLLSNKSLYLDSSKNSC